MSRKRLFISVAAGLVLAFAGAACSIGGDNETVTTTVTVGETTASSSGKTVKIVASVPPTDHGWLGAISKNAKAAAEQYDDVDFELLEAADADSHINQNFGFGSG